MGNLFWTPDFLRRRRYTDLLFEGRIPPPGRAAILALEPRPVPARRVPGTTDLTKALGGLLADVKHFGCATVYELKA